MPDEEQLWSSGATQIEAEVLMTGLEGKTILITGATAGFGEACAGRFAAHGAALVLIGRREDRLTRTKKHLEDKHGVSVHVYPLDVRDRDAVEVFGGELERRGLDIDVLVNNAGLASGLSKLHEGSHEDWDRMIDTNIKGLLNMSRCVIPMMVKRDRGHVVNIGSVAGHTVYPNGNVYNATKFAVRALNEAMNIDLVGTNIRVSSVDPGAADTEFSKVRFHGDEDKARAISRARPR